MRSSRACDDDGVGPRRGRSVEVGHDLAVELQHTVGHVLRDALVGQHPGQPDADRRQLLLVVDQFEELFTLDWDPAERTRFIRAFGEVVRGHRTSTDGDEGLGDAAMAGADLWKRRTALDADCPLDSAETEALFGRMRELLERIFAVERALIDELAAAHGDVG